MDALAVYRMLLRAYPVEVRDAYGDDMTQLFADQLRDARPGWSTAGVWIRAAGDVLRTAPAQRVATRRARVADGPATPPPDASRLWCAVLAAPSLLVPFTVFLQPEPMGGGRATLFGLPALTIILGAWAVVASGLAVVLVRARSFALRFLAGVAMNILLIPVFLAPMVGLVLIHVAS